MPRRPFVDTHVHFNDMSHPELRWTWLEAGQGHPLIANPEGYKHLRFTAQELAGEVRFSNVQKVVHVQAALGTDDPVAESVWLSEMAERTGWPNAIVGQAFLAASDVDTVLARHAELPLVRGVRDLRGVERLTEPAFERGYRRLAAHGLMIALAPSWEQMPAAASLAAAHPETVLVIEHTGMPLERGSDYFARWRSELTNLARLDNVIVKISGLGMTDPQWTTDTLRPWVDATIEAFGTDRCMFGTNWPVDRLFSSYTDLVDAYAELTSDLSDPEQDALFHGNATRWFDL